MAFGVSSLLHAGLFYADRFRPKISHKYTPVVVETVIQMELPPLESDKPEEVTDLPEESAAPQLAPPTLAEPLTAVPIDAFVQPLATPPLPGIVGKNILMIPTRPLGAGLGKGLESLFSLENLDQRPVLKSRVPPDFPPEMLRSSTPGEVRVEFIIDAQGEVTSVEVVGSSHYAFEAPAVRAVQRWKFRPGRKGGRNVNTRVAQVITFDLEEYRRDGTVQ